MKNKGKKYVTFPIMAHEPAKDRKTQKEANIEQIRKRAREMGIKLADE